MIIVRKANVVSKPVAPIRNATAQELVAYNKAVRNIGEKVLLPNKPANCHFTPMCNNDTTRLVFTKQ